MIQSCEVSLHPLLDFQSLYRWHFFLPLNAKSAPGGTALLVFSIYLENTLF